MRGSFAKGGEEVHEEASVRDPRTVRGDRGLLHHARRGREWDGEGGVGEFLGWFRDRERDGAEAVEERAEETAGFAIRDAVFQQGLEDVVNLPWNFLRLEPGKAAVEAGPVADARVAVAFGNRRRTEGRAGGVVAAEVLVAGGGAAALFAAGQDMGAFGRHRCPSWKRW